MKRLPGYDKNTGRSETVAFLTLGVAAILLMLFSLTNAPKTADRPEPIAGPALIEPIMAFNRTEDSRTNLALTNVLLIRSPEPSGQAPPRNGLAAPRG